MNVPFEHKGLKQKTHHPASHAREVVLCFLYQCETRGLFYFADTHFDDFVKSFGIDASVVGVARRLAQGTLGQLCTLDAMIEERIRPRWQIQRLATLDRLVMRLAAAELSLSETPRKVVVNEAVELAKRYGTERSGSFVNAVVDSLQPSAPGQT